MSEDSDWESNASEPENDVDERPPRRKKRPAVEEEYECHEDDFLPSYARKTAKGGYAHMTSTKLKISRANKGNVPANLGKNRSQSTRAKISAGVKARNRAKLLEQLEKMGLTEEEWNERKKKLKYIRERHRRTKKENDERKPATADPTRIVVQSVDLPLESEEESDIEEAAIMEADPSNPDVGASSLEEAVQLEVDRVVNGILEGAQSMRKIDPTQVLYQRDVVWTPHEFDADPEAWRQCPTGGPGGLICCPPCVSKYMDFMTSSCLDMERCLNTKVHNELAELTDFFRSTKATLKESYRAGRKRRPPSKTRKAPPSARKKSKKDTESMII